MLSLYKIGVLGAFDIFVGNNFLYGKIFMNDTFMHLGLNSWVAKYHFLVLGDNHIL